MKVCFVHGIELLKPLEKNVISKKRQKKSDRVRLEVFLACPLPNPGHCGVGSGPAIV